MFDFSSFKTFDFNEGTPYVSVTKNGVLFNKGTVLKLGKPSHVILLINEESKQIAIKTCSELVPQCYPFFKPNNRGVVSVRWNSKDLLSTFQILTGWDLENDAYRVEGQLLSDDNAMLFDLNKAEKIT